MAIKTMTATVNGQTYNLTLNESTGKYEAVITAPSASSFNLSGGYYPISVEAVDTAGNKTTVDSSHSTLGDNLKLYVKEQIKPVISILEPSTGAYVTTGKPTIKFKIVDNSNGQTEGFSGINKNSVVLKINGNAVSGVTFEETTGGYIGTYTPTAELADGDITITVDGADNDGNAATTATAKFKIDTVAPTLTITSPADGYETNQPELTVEGVTNDATSKPVAVNVKLNGRDLGNATVNSDGTFSKGITLDVQGENVIVVTATDSASKETSVTKTVVFNTTAPTIKSVVIDPNPVNAGKTFTITVEVE